MPNIRRVADRKVAGAVAGNEAVDLLEGADGFAEVYPEDKYIVVQHLWRWSVSFLVLLYFAVFSVVSARERRWFWATLPSKTFLFAISADAITGTVLTFVELPGLVPLPWSQMLAVFVYAMVSCLILNDAVKVAMTRWRVPNAVAGKPADAAAPSKG